MSSLCLILLFALAAPAQKAPQSQPPSRNQQKVEVDGNRLALDALNAAEAARLQDGLFDSHTCFTMRTYYFKSEKGKAPELAGTSTCTPANAFRSEKARRTPPKLVLVPLKVN